MIVRNDRNENSIAIMCLNEECRKQIPKGNITKSCDLHFNGQRPYSFKATASYAESNSPTKDTKWHVQSTMLR